MSSPRWPHFPELCEGRWQLLWTPQRKNLIHWRLHLTSQGMAILLSLLDCNVNCESQICKRNKHRGCILMAFGLFFLFSILQILLSCWGEEKMGQLPTAGWNGSSVTTHMAVLLLTLNNSTRAGLTGERSWGSGAWMMFLLSCFLLPSLVHL